MFYWRHVTHFSDTYSECDMQTFVNGAETIDLEKIEQSVSLLNGSLICSICLLFFLLVNSYCTIRSLPRLTRGKDTLYCYFINHTILLIGAIVILALTLSTLGVFAEQKEAV